MFIWNNIFFSYAFDSRDHFQGVGGRMNVAIKFRLEIQSNLDWKFVFCARANIHESLAT